MKKISFAKVGLLIKNNYVINRSLPLILFIVVFALGCIIGAMPVSDVENRYDYNIVMDIHSYESYTRSMTNVYDELLGSDSVFSLVYIVTALILSFLAVLSLNGFMRDKSGNDFYHSLAVNRGELFLANYITAFVNTAVTIILSQLVGLLLMNFIADYKPMSLGEIILEQLPVIATIILFAALFTALAMIATIAAGTIFAGIVNYLCINFYIPATILAVALSGDILFNSNLMEYLNHFPYAYAYTSPLIRYIFAIAYDTRLTVWSYIIIAAVTVLLVALGIWIYSVKKNENNAKTLPFTRMIRPMQYLLIFDAILLGATFFEAITNSFIWLIIGGLLTLFFAFIAFNAFAEKSFNGVFKHSRHMIFIFIFTLVAGTVFVADAFGIYKEPKADLDKMTDCYLHVYVNDEQNYKQTSYDFMQEINEHNSSYASDIDEAREQLKELWTLLNEYNSEYRSEAYDKITEDNEYMSVSMGINCEGDFSRYHAYVSIYDTDEYYDEISAILEKLESEHRVQDVYIEETTEYTEKY